jgi:predicted phosphodiesterase
MPPVRILHASDLHLAEFPLSRSIIDDQQAKLDAAKELLSDVVEALKEGRLGDVINFLGEAIVSPLAEAVSSFDRKRLNEEIDAALMKIAGSDILVDYISTDILRKVFAASSYDPGAVECLSTFIDTRDDFDALILTGDIATTGDSNDLEKARVFLEGPPGGRNDYEAELTIAGLIQPVHVLPGNHDRYTYSDLGFLYSPGGNEFDQILQRHWSGKVKVFSPPIRKEQDEISVLVVAADFGLQRPEDCTWPLLKVNRLAQGRVYPNILDELRAATAAAQESERAQYPRNTIVTLWAVHFPPFFPYSGRFEFMHRRTHNLIDEHDLVARAAECGVQAILAGHTHKADDYPAGREQVRVLCAGTATQNEDSDRQIQILNISKGWDGEIDIEVENYLLDVDASTFVRHPDEAG